eukprot:133592-Prymnesium_polylepis.1
MARVPNPPAAKASGAHARAHAARLTRRGAHVAWRKLNVDVHARTAHRAPHAHKRAARTTQHAHKARARSAQRAARSTHKGTPARPSDAARSRGQGCGAGVGAARGRAARAAGEGARAKGEERAGTRCAPLSAYATRTDALWHLCVALPSHLGVHTCRPPR